MVTLVTIGKIRISPMSRALYEVRSEVMNGRNKASYPSFGWIEIGLGGVLIGVMTVFGPHRCITCMSESGSVVVGASLSARVPRSTRPVPLRPHAACRRRADGECDLSRGPALEARAGEMRHRRSREPRAGSV